MKSNPQNDSLRAFVGSEFMYGGRMDLGYEFSHPLFEQEKAPKDVEKLIHTEIGYQSYERKKELYRQYPEFFWTSWRRN
ncbi:MAG: hypothetical protein U5K69_20685 [Balneolaceae bacterium]|nr:hypothetical protein [Balneolaceae bacterium]